MRDLGEALGAKCFLVRSILLPGHGTIPGDLLEVEYNEWVAAFSAAVEVFPPSIKQVIPIGYSTGASVAIYYVQNMAIDPKLKGIVLLAPGIKAFDENIGLSGLHRIYSWLIPKGAWFSLHEDKDLYKYESLPKNAAYQFHLLTKAIRENRSMFRMPLMMIGSAEDGTIEMKTAVQFICKRAISLTRIIVYHSNRLDSNYGRDCPNISVRDSPSTLFNVIDYSHLALPVKPSNPYYGYMKEYRNCLHYQDDYFKREQCMNGEFVYGESLSRNLKKYVIRRLTFNPDFEQTVQDILQFIDSILLTDTRTSRANLVSRHAPPLH
jgi:esterase/lipase